MIKDMTNKKQKALRYDWVRDIEPYLDTIKTVKGGYTPAKRGVVTIADGTKVFIKIAIDSMTHRWLKKEIRAYQILNSAGYPFMPMLLSHNEDENSMAIEYLDHAEFDDTWDKDKLTAIMQAQQSLKDYKAYFADDKEFRLDNMVIVDARWQRIREHLNIDIINQKFVRFGIDLQFTHTQIERFHSMMDGWALKQDTLIHEDIRADNFGYFPDTQTGKLIDWNWLAVGDESLDTTALFVHLYASGFDPYVEFPEKYDPRMLIYLVCFWLDSVLVGNEDSSDREYSLRKAQASSVRTCVELLQRQVIR
jgi:hypothetical protein